MHPPVGDQHTRKTHRGVLHADNGFHIGWGNGFFPDYISLTVQAYASVEGYVSVHFRQGDSVYIGLAAAGGYERHYTFFTQGTYGPYSRKRHTVRVETYKSPVHIEKYGFYHRYWVVCCSRP